MAVSLRQLAVGLLTLYAGVASAQDVYVPEALREWQPWVLEGHEYRECPFYFNRGGTASSDYVCRWPGELELSVDAGGGRFSQSWTVAGDDAWLPLPGDARHWPDRVTVNGSAAAVIEHNGIPSVRVAPGRYRLSGRFEWSERPGVLRIPDDSALIALSVDGRRIQNPDIGRGGVFLGERETGDQTRDSVRTEVYRLVADDVPTVLMTRLQVDASGSVREELFGPLLPAGFVPVRLESALPARLEPDGRLRVQLRPGRWYVTLTARADGVLNEVALPEVESNLPATEIWSYNANERLRVTAPEGLPPIDPLQADVPDEWTELPAFRIEPGQALRIVERSRGIVSADNDLILNREMWLDFSGDGFAVRDAVNGTMQTGWRLDMQPPYALQSAEEADEPLLVTRGDVEGSAGVELRRRNVDLQAQARADVRGSMAVTGWDARFNAVSAMLYLPPGHKLLTAPGVDRANGSWTNQWQLLDFFLLLIITIAAWKLFGRTAGIIALLALTLSYHEMGAPRGMWLNLLAAIALLRVTPPGRLLTLVRGYLGVSALLLVFALVPFLAGQLRIAIYPQLEPQYGAARAFESVDHFSDAVQMSAPAQVRRAPESKELAEIVVTGSRVTNENFARYAPNAIVQAGPGIPSWQWNAYQLNWSGPVDAEQAMRLIILPRWAVSTLRVLTVLLIALFAGVLAAEIAKRRWRLPGGLTLGRATAALLLGVGLATTPVQNVQAETPDPALLEELQKRLLAAPDCAPRCAEILDADVSVRGNAVNVTLTIDALEEVAVPLPGSLRGWRPNGVTVEGGSQAEVLRASNGEFWLRVQSGRHSVRVAGSAAGVDSFEIAFPTPPRVVNADADGWFIAGLQDRRLVSGSLQFTRLQTTSEGGGAPRWEANRFPPFVKVTRNVELGLDWRVTTIVERVAPETGGLTVELPLLDGESVLSDGMTVVDGRMVVSMNPTQRQVAWMSNLPRRSPLELTAADASPWTEIWKVAVGSVWHAEFAGVPESESQSSGQSVRNATFYPRPGEALTVTATRPEAVAGSTLAFDAVELSVDRGARSGTAELMLQYRSTRGAQHVITLPDGAEVTAVVIDGRPEPLAARDGELQLPILPGEHTVQVEWRNSSDIGVVERTPTVNLGAPASNIELAMNLPQNRWLLLASGPPLGPGVLYWSELALMILLALILGRIDWTPLKTHHWLLLGLGFSTFNWPALGIVAGWLLVTGARDKWRFEGPWWRYNLQQVAVAAFTVIALGAILSTLPGGLLGSPDMHVSGNGSWGNMLRWFADRSVDVLPVASAITVPLWIYKALILAWSLWLSFALLKWLPWVWQCFARDGFFRSRRHDDLAASEGDKR